MAENKYDFASRINEKLGIRDVRLVESIIGEFGPTMTEILMEGKELNIKNLGRFFKKYKEGMHNPRTGEPVPPMFIFKFVVTSTIRSTIKTSKADYFINEKKIDDLKDS